MFYDYYVLDFFFFTFMISNYKTIFNFEFLYSILLLLKLSAGVVFLLLLLLLLIFFFYNFIIIVKLFNFGLCLFRFTDMINLERVVGFFMILLISEIIFCVCCIRYFFSCDPKESDISWLQFWKVGSFYIVVLQKYLPGIWEVW